MSNPLNCCHFPALCQGCQSLLQNRLPACTGHVPSPGSTPGHGANSRQGPKTALQMLLSGFFSPFHTARSRCPSQRRALCRDHSALPRHPLLCTLPSCTRGLSRLIWKRKSSFESTTRARASSWQRSKAPPAAGWWARGVPPRSEPRPLRAGSRRVSFPAAGRTRWPSHSGEGTLSRRKAAPAGARPPPTLPPRAPFAGHRRCGCEQKASEPGERGAGGCRPASDGPAARKGSEIPRSGGPQRSHQLPAVIYAKASGSRASAAPRLLGLLRAAGLATKTSPDRSPR